MYLRLSVEDDGEKEESNSISNQRKLIYEYIAGDSKLCRYETVEFCDDGYSGMNMKRPGMQDLLKEVKENRLQCIIVKDMSRFSRDYIEMGTCLNQLFPFMGIRFIAINDSYDSREHHGSTIELDTAFRTLLYDFYTKDISAKVKASFDSKCARGEYVFGQVPFGYEKSRKVKNAVLINEREAQIVRDIFFLALQGKSSTEIARTLYEKKVPTILQMRKPDKELTDDRIHSWSEQAIRRILNNRFYLGEMVYGKEAGMVIQNHHEALISEEIFKQVSLFKPELATKRKREKHPLTGKLYCGCCGYSVNYKPATEKNRYERFECRKHALWRLPECCTYMRADSLEEVILYMLHKELMLWGNVSQQKKKVTAFQQSSMLSLQKKRESVWKEKKCLRAEEAELYEKYALGELSACEYRRREEKRTKRLSELSAGTDEEERRKVLQYSQMEELTQEIADTFIQKVSIYKDKRVEIEWTFCCIKV